VLNLPGLFQVQQTIEKGRFAHGPDPPPSIKTSE